MKQESAFLCPFCRSAPKGASGGEKSLKIYLKKILLNSLSGIQIGLTTSKNLLKLILLIFLHTYTTMRMNVRLQMKSIALVVDITLKTKRLTMEVV